MSHPQIEIEIKTLLGSEEAAQSLISRLRENDPKCLLQSQSKQLNHYFTSGNMKKLRTVMKKVLPTSSWKEFTTILSHAASLSVRTRKSDTTVLFIMKATLDETTSSNGTARAEFEVVLPSCSLDELDAILLSADFTYQAKWSRERQEYSYKKYTVSIDKNAGYGYLAEFERLITDLTLVEAVKSEIRGELSKLGLEELSQDRLERMFAFYNAHWDSYYGTEKTFTIK